MAKPEPGLCGRCNLHRELLRKPVVSLVDDIHERAIQGLHGVGIETLGDLAFYAHKNRFRGDPPPPSNFCHLMMVRGVGRATVRRIREGLQRDPESKAAMEQRYRDLRHWSELLERGLIQQSHFDQLADRPAAP